MAGCWWFCGKYHFYHTALVVPDLLAIVLGVFVVKTCQDYSNVMLKRTPGKTLCFFEGRSQLISCQEYWVYLWLVSTTCSPIEVQYIDSCQLLWPSQCLLVCADVVFKVNWFPFGVSYWNDIWCGHCDVWREKHLFHLAEQHLAQDLVA